MSLKLAASPSDELRRQIAEHADKLRRALGWRGASIELARGRCPAPFRRVHVDLDGWHLRSSCGARRWLGRNLDDAAAELNRLVEGS
jgi:hypothetical protein